MSDINVLEELGDQLFILADGDAWPKALRTYPCWASSPRVRTRCLVPRRRGKRALYRVRSPESSDCTRCDRRNRSLPTDQRFVDLIQLGDNRPPRELLLRQYPPCRPHPGGKGGI
jgi:hypothetical protein